jgi:ubiquinol-cytochrome c reductase cytochrome b subunit
MSITTLQFKRKRQSAAVNLAAQRLNAENQKYAYLVGLIEGDGWFSFSKNGKYLIYEMGIELHIRDLPLLCKIKHLLSNIGNRNTYKKSTKCRYSIRNKNDLRKIILPIFDKYPMLSNKSHTYF